MTISSDAFDSRVRQVMADKPNWFEMTESVASEEEIARVEAELGCALPKQFRHFAMTFGGGYFGGLNVATVKERSDWYILSRPRVSVPEGRLLVISDDQAGGYYGFIQAAHEAAGGIWYAHPDDGQHRELAARSFFEFIETFALKV